MICMPNHSEEGAHEGSCWILPQRHMPRHHWGNDRGGEDVTSPSEAELDVINTNYHEERLGHVRKAIHHVEQRSKQECSQGIAIQLDQAMLQMLLAKVEIAEPYSPPRVTQNGARDGAMIRMEFRFHHQ